MIVEYDVLVIHESNDVVSLERQTITDNKIPEFINGESGHHICYVRTLTELIARWLVENSEQYVMTEEDIEKMALAASLHDVGKLRIPHAILEKKSYLTPVEYDIVKKHTVFGVQLLREAKTALDPKLQQYIYEVTRYHHERYDGTGYPNGTKGDEIPIVAQIVSIADAYEALTSDRSYKKAFSRDVALEMIANGMCGVFNPVLVDGLIQVTNDKVLSDIREQLTASSSFYIDSYLPSPRKVLLTGNLRYVTKQFLETAFPEAHISVIGKCELPHMPKLKVYHTDKLRYKEILDTYDFDFIVFFSNELTYDSSDASDIEELDQILMAARYVSDKTKFLYLSSLDAAFHEQNEKGIISAAKEKLCTYWAEENQINLKIIRIPYLYNGAAKDDYLYRVFEQMQSGKLVRLKDTATSQTFFLSTRDLAELLVHITDTWTFGEGILTIGDDFHITFGELCSGLRKLKKDVSFDFMAENPSHRLEYSNTAIKKQYGWAPQISMLSDLGEQYKAYLESEVPKKSRWNVWKDKFAKQELAAKIPYGAGAALFCLVLWFAAKISSGVTVTEFMYDPINWLATLCFVLVGILYEYFKYKTENRIRDVKKENNILEDKLTFTRQIYEDSFYEKRELKKQILGSKDSFKKISDIARQLDTVDSRELYLKIVNSFESVLENESVSVFSVNQGSTFARLEVASGDIMGEVSRSISLETYAPVMQILEKGEVWRNKNLIPNMPMLACGIYQDEQLLLIIFLWSAQIHQRSLYYVNLFRFLCDLTQMSLIRAHNYAQAMHDSHYIENTMIQNTETFKHNLRIFEELSRRKVFRFVQLEIVWEGRELKELSDLLTGCIRMNDIVGLDENGRVMILFAQAGREDLQFMLPRLERLGIEIKA